MYVEFKNYMGCEEMRWKYILAQTPAFDKDGYVERMEKLFKNLNSAKVSGADIEPILKCMEKEIDVYFEYRKSVNFKWPFHRQPISS